MKKKIISILFFALYLFIISIILNIIYLDKILDGLENNKYFVYISILSIILLILIIYRTFFFNANNFKNLLLLFIVSTLSIITMEILVNYINFKNKINLQAASVNKNIDLNQIYLDLLKK